MGGQFTQKIALGLSPEMLKSLDREAKKAGRTVLAQIRYYCTGGLENDAKGNLLANDLAELKRRLDAMDAERHGESVKRGRRKSSG